MIICVLGCGARDVGLQTKLVFQSVRFKIEHIYYFPNCDCGLASLVIDFRFWLCQLSGCLDVRVGLLLCVLAFVYFP